MITVYAAIGQDVDDDNGAPIPSSGASVPATPRIVNLLRDGVLLTESPLEEVVANQTRDPFGNFVNVQWFGAVGDGAQALVSDAYTVGYTSITQQTIDGKAINDAIRFLRTLGGGALYFPKGAYRVYATLEAINFNCVIFGDGRGITTLKNCDASPTLLGAYDDYGIFRTGEPSVFDRVATIYKISFRDMTLDGNATGRALPTVERQTMCMRLDAMANYTLDNLEVKDAPMDCLVTYMQSRASVLGASFQEAARLVSLQASNCLFDTAFRNTVSLVGGDNQTYTNCEFRNGGRVGGGAQPKACLDIEADGGAFAIYNIAFVNCLFYGGKSYCAASNWAAARFTGCTFVTTGDADSPASGQCPIICRDSQLEVENCTFRNEATDADRFKSYIYVFSSRFYDTPGYPSPFDETYRVTIRGCTLEGVGLHVDGKNRLLVENCTFSNSLWPIYVGDVDATSTIVLRNLYLLNMADALPITGAYPTGFCIANACDAKTIDIENVLIEFDGARLPQPVATGTATNGSNQLTGVSTTRDLYVGMAIRESSSGASIGYITVIAGTTITMSASYAGATGSKTLYFIDDRFLGTFDATGLQFGCQISPTLSADSSVRVCNLHIRGYRKRMPLYFGRAQDVNRFRDIGNRAPNGSAGDSSTPADTASFAVGAMYFKNVTIHGDAL